MIVRVDITINQCFISATIATVGGNTVACNLPLRLRWLRCYRSIGWWMNQRVSIRIKYINITDIHVLVDIDILPVIGRSCLDSDSGSNSTVFKYYSCRLFILSIRKWTWSGCLPCFTIQNLYFISQNTSCTVVIICWAIIPSWRIVNCLNDNVSVKVDLEILLRKWLFRCRYPESCSVLINCILNIGSFRSIITGRFQRNFRSDRMYKWITCSIHDIQFSNVHVLVSTVFPEIRWQCSETDTVRSNSGIQCVCAIQHFRVFCISDHSNRFIVAVILFSFNLEYFDCTSTVILCICIISRYISDLIECMFLCKIKLVICILQICRCRLPVCRWIWVNCTVNISSFVCFLICAIRRSDKMSAGSCRLQCLCAICRSDTC